MKMQYVLQEIPEKFSAKGAHGATRLSAYAKATADESTIN